MTAGEVLAGLDLADLVGALSAAMRDPETLATLVDGVDSPEVVLWFRERRRDLGAALADDAIRLLRRQARATRKSIVVAERLESGPEPGVYRERTYPEPGVLALLQKTKPRSEDETPKIRRNAWNLGTILREDSRWRGRFRWNELRGEEEIRNNDVWRQLADVDDVNLCRWLSDTYGLDYTTGVAREQVTSVAYENRAHPVRQYLLSLAWDRTERLDSMLSTYFGAEQTDLHAAIGRCWMVSLVARVMEPGCKVDTVPILVGFQGYLKSTTVGALVPDRSWYCASDIPLHHNQDQYQVLKGKWVYEIKEFDRFSGKADAARVKAYVDEPYDTYRESFGRRMADRPRQVVFVGTTNAPEFLVDPSGARRFWPVPCGECRPDLMAEGRDQLWAEALHRYHRGENWWLDRTQAAAMAAQASDFAVSDPWEPRVANWIESCTTDVTVPTILGAALGMDVRDQDVRAASRVRAILQHLGWRLTARRCGPRGKTGPKIWEAP